MPLDEDRRLRLLEQVAGRETDSDESCADAPSDEPEEDVSVQSRWREARAISIRMEAATWAWLDLEIAGHLLPPPPLYPYDTLPRRAAGTPPTHRDVSRRGLPPRGRHRSGSGPDRDTGDTATVTAHRTQPVPQEPTCGAVSGIPPPQHAQAPALSSIPSPPSHPRPQDARQNLNSARSQLSAYQ